MATIEELNDMPPGLDRIRAAHRTAGDAADAAKPAREQLTKAAWELRYRHKWSKAKASEKTGLFSTTLFPAASLVEPSEEEILERLPGWDLETALAEREAAAAKFATQRAIEDAAREIRRKDVAALYQGHIDGRQWDQAEIGAEFGMDTTMVKADLKAMGVELRPSQRRKVASEEGAPVDLGPISRMLGVSRLYLKAVIRYWGDPARAEDPKAFPQDAAAGEGKYWPGKVKQWFERLPVVAASPTGLTLARAAERVGEPYEAVKAAIDSAAEDGTLPADVVYSNGAVHEERFTAWWRERKERLYSGDSLITLAELLKVDYKGLRTKVRAAEEAGELPKGVKLGERYDRIQFLSWWRAISSVTSEGVTMKALAEALGVKPEKVRYQVRKADEAGGLPAGVRLENGRFDFDAARTWWRSLGL
ncbi:hypothetical protein [Nonomuraea dietziae]|uniref:hypothetical protein n=1 Tax=Nonomuraea dietziae TaxID=65515 RepID=UPI0033C5FD32